MPLIRTKPSEGRRVDHVVTLTVHPAAGVLPAKHFHVGAEHAPGKLPIEPSRAGISRLVEAVIVQAFLNHSHEELAIELVAGRQELVLRQRRAQSAFNGDDS